MPLDSATAAFLAQMGDGGSKPLHEMTPEEARSLGGALAELYGEGPDMHIVADLSAEARDGHSIPLRLLCPVGNPRAVIVYYHGGGWTMGSLPEFETLGRTLADKTDCAVVMVEYRLAPEYRYPIAVDDAWDALQWVNDNLLEIVGRSVPLIVAGDSAGGNLAAVMAIKARDSGITQLEMQVLICPVADCDLNTGSYLDPTNQLIVSRDAMEWFWDHYAPDQKTRTNSDASPARVTNLSNLPAAVVVTAEYDVLRDEGENYARLLEKAGVPVTARTFDGQMHDFITFVNVLPGSTKGIDFVTEAIDKHLRKYDKSPQ